MGSKPGLVRSIAGVFFRPRQFVEASLHLFQLLEKDFLLLAKRYKTLFFPRIQVCFGVVRACRDKLRH